MVNPAPPKKKTQYTPNILASRYMFVPTFNPRMFLFIGSLHGAELYFPRYYQFSLIFGTTESIWKELLSQKERLVPNSIFYSFHKWFGIVCKNLRGVYVIFVVLIWCNKALSSNLCITTRIMRVNSKQMS